ncbi:tripartite tricarboxylate transporter TctB family protein [Haladaptatus caseinilyticus]|uniref:tripartite tricarboxylate transporter TctB family protein n=1 Tax=Haladaptatus caseinilyticus TaxID=2993314 RepID=UPI00224B2DD7|nr:tripartite tricarboxylate transporter TctB family protein [Haladaptatus caseinilyticus]
MSFKIRHATHISSILLILLSAGVFFVSGTFPASPNASAPGAGFFPRVIAVGIGGMALVQLIRPNEQRVYTVTRDDITTVGSVIGFLVGYIVLMPILGFFLDTVVFLFAFMWYSGVRQPSLAAAISVGLTFVLYYTFVGFLTVSLPESAILPVTDLLPIQLGILEVSTR